MSDILDTLESMLESAKSKEEIAYIQGLFDSYVTVLEARGGNYNPFFTAHTGKGYKEDTRLGKRVGDWGGQSDQMLDDTLRGIDPNSQEVKDLQKESEIVFKDQYGIRVSASFDDLGRITDVNFKDNLKINSRGEIYAVNDEDEVIEIPKSIPTDRHGERDFAYAGDSIGDEFFPKFSNIYNELWGERLEHLNPNRPTSYTTGNASLGGIARYKPELLDKIKDEDLWEFRPTDQVHGPGIRSNIEAGTEYKNKFGLDSEEDVNKLFSNISKTDDLAMLIYPEIEDEISVIKNIYKLPNIRDDIKTTVVYRFDDLMNVRNQAPTKKHVKGLIATILGYMEPMQQSRIISLVDSIKDNDSDAAQLMSDMYKLAEYINTMVFPGLFNDRGGMYSPQILSAGIRKLITVLNRYDNEKTYKRGLSPNVIRENLITAVEGLFGSDPTYDQDNMITDTGDSVFQELYNKLVKSIKD